MVYESRRMSRVGVNSVRKVVCSGECVPETAMTWNDMQHQSP